MSPYKVTQVNVVRAHPSLTPSASTTPMLVPPSRRHPHLVVTSLPSLSRLRPALDTSTSRAIANLVQRCPDTGMFHRSMFTPWLLLTLLHTCPERGNKRLFRSQAVLRYVPAAPMRRFQRSTLLAVQGRRSVFASLASGFRVRTYCLSTLASTDHIPSRLEHYPAAGISRARSMDAPGEVSKPGRGRVA